MISCQLLARSRGGLGDSHVEVDVLDGQLPLDELRVLFAVDVECSFGDGREGGGFEGDAEGSCVSSRLVVCVWMR